MRGETIFQKLFAGRRGVSELKVAVDRNEGRRLRNAVPEEGPFLGRNEEVGRKRMKAIR